MSDAPKIFLTLPTGEVRKYSLQMDSVRIGRAADNTIVIDDPGLSSHHAVLHRRIDTFEIIDLGSTNGLEMDGRRIISRELQHGDQITIGDVVMRYEVPGMEPAPPPLPPAGPPPASEPEEEKAPAPPPAEADEDPAAPPEPSLSPPPDKGGCLGAFVLFLFTLLAPIVGLHARHFVETKGQILAIDIVQHRSAEATPATPATSGVPEP